MAFESNMPATSAGLHKWVKTMFTKLGWMLLAERSNRKSCIRSYMDDLRYIHSLLQQKVQATLDPDRKADLLILQGNVQYLEMRCKDIFSKLSSSSGRRTTRLSEAAAPLPLTSNDDTESSDAIINPDNDSPMSTSGLLRKKRSNNTSSLFVSNKENKKKNTYSYNSLFGV